MPEQKKSFRESVKVKFSSGKKFLIGVTAIGGGIVGGVSGLFSKDERAAAFNALEANNNALTVETMAASDVAAAHPNEIVTPGMFAEYELAKPKILELKRKQTEANHEQTADLPNVVTTSGKKGALRGLLVGGIAAAGAGALQASRKLRGKKYLGSDVEIPVNSHDIKKLIVRSNGDLVIDAHKEWNAIGIVVQLEPLRISDSRSPMSSNDDGRRHEDRIVVYPRAKKDKLLTFQLDVVNRLNLPSQQYADIKNLLTEIDAERNPPAVEPVRAR